MKKTEFRVVNIRFEECDYYIGRPTPLGNPFHVSIGRTACIEEYRHWLWRKIKQRDNAVLSQLINIWLTVPKQNEPVRLGCHCVPLDCHGTIVIKALESQQVKKILAEFIVSKLTPEQIEILKGNMNEIA